MISGYNCILQKADGTDAAANTVAADGRLGRAYSFPTSILEDVADGQAIVSLPSLRRLLLLEISATDAWTLFNSLNLDGNHVLTLDEFTEGCLLLRGNARSVDVFALKQQNKKIREQISGLAKMHTELSQFLLERDTVSTRWPPVPHGRLEVIST